MKFRNTIVALVLVTLSVACGQQADQSAAATEDEATTPAITEETEVTETGTESVAVVGIVDGLTARILRTGDGQVAKTGDIVVVHYTGWLFDETAADHRGSKFDSSVDRGEHFQFPLGAGRVIKGWDQGIEGMVIGEVRELTIAPAMAYGDRGAGDVIPPGSTLIFEVELFDLQSLGAPGGQ